MNDTRLEPLIFTKSVDGLRGTEPPGAGVAERAVADLLPGVTLREEPPRLPEVAEPQVVRHFTRLSQLNFCVDSGLYPLGSCTMKYNPKLNDEAAAMEGFSGLHPYQEPADTQGILQLMHGLERALASLLGLHRVSLQPAAGAHGELAGILMVKAFHRDHGGAERDTVLVPDSAHGTNLASAAMAGYRVVEIPSSSEGLVDLAALQNLLSERTAALMLTNPNTLGLFEREIAEICAAVHAVGGLCYYDGANMNAIMGKVRPGDMGIDVAHLNLHKTFSTPHGGGGPGAGPVAVTERLEPYLPVPLVSYSQGKNRYELDYDRPQSIGRVRAFHGSVGILIRAYSYILTMGGDGLTSASEDAVLAANYLRARLDQLYRVPHDTVCMHEFVMSAARQVSRGATARDIAKRLLDFGIHAPTIYFPLIVPEALMIEPTETEDLATLDAFVSTMERIDEEIDRELDTVRRAPCSTPVRRPDETRAARHPVLRWTPGDARKCEHSANH